MIDIKNLDFSINGAVILNGISASINDGETVGIIGRSGSGKTIFLKCIAGLTGNFRGSVAINGAPLPRRKPETRKIVSFYGADCPRNPEVALHEFLLDARIPYKKVFSPFSDYDRQITEEYTGLFGLGPYSEKKIGTLPDGIFRLAMLARTFIGEAYAVVLDNPTNDLDIGSVRMLKKVVGRYVMNGDRAAIVCSNDLNFISQTADRIFIMDGGRIVETCVADILDADLVKKYFGIDVIISKNIYNGRPEFHIFPDV
jgi:iron complex transport system ATP-binding protein